MDKAEYEKLDALLRVLFKEGQMAWYHVYTKANITKMDADWLYKTLKADGYVKTMHKGSDFTIPDRHVVDLTDLGRSWFSHSNYIKEYIEPKYIGQTINIQNSAISGNNTQIGFENHQKDIKPSNEQKSFWTNGWTIAIGSGIILVILERIFNIF